ncbi:MAG: transaldolase [Candidatus Omnitrophota bacterium]
MKKAILGNLAEAGQSAWLDNINRSMLESGKLSGLVYLGLRGMTSNPAIFDKSIRLSDDYDRYIEELANAGKSAFEIYDALTIKDVQDASDIFKPVYEKTNRVDGYVSLEVNPKLAFNKEETIKDALRLHKSVNRENVMFKIPATDEGCAAIEELLGQGININATLIFSRAQYIKVADSFIKGIRRFLKKGGDITKVHSVASVFVSRIDSTIDKLLDEKDAKGLEGKAAVANSRAIYKSYLEIFGEKDFKSLKEKGANIQRVLWASTSTKNPNYSDLKYVEELIGKDTVNTMPDNTLDAFLDHGSVKDALNGDLSEDDIAIEELNKLGINVDDVCLTLLKDGLTAFEKSFDALLSSIENKIKDLCSI